MFFQLSGCPNHEQDCRHGSWNSPKVLFRPKHEMKMPENSHFVRAKLQIGSTKTQVLEIKWD